MRRSLIAALVFLAATAAQAHVLLTTPYSVSGPPGIATCSAPHMTAIQWTPITNGASLTGVTIIYQLGTATFSGGVDTGWTPSTCAPAYTFLLNFASGQWTLSTGGNAFASGTMAGVTLSTALSNYQTANAHQFNDDADQFLTVTGTGLLGTALGTQPDVWATGDN